MVVAGLQPSEGASVSSHLAGQHAWLPSPVLVSNDPRGELRQHVDLAPAGYTERWDVRLG